MPGEQKLPATATLYEYAACGLLLTHPDGTILQANATFTNWIGYQESELVGIRKLQELFTIGGRIFHQTHWSPLLRMQGSVSEVKLDIVKRDGKKIPMVLNAISRNHGDETFHEIAAFVAEDRNKYEKEILNARKRAEELLRLAEQMMGIVSHDLRNPLNTIMLCAKVLEREALTDSQSRTVARIGRAGDRAGRLISDMLDFTTIRLGAGLKITRKPTDLSAFIAGCIEELSAAFPTRTLKHETPPAGTFDFDADRLFQLIGNLVANADAYGAAGTEITIASEILPNAMRLSVRNEGTPIPAEKLPELFAPMVRGTSDAGDRKSVGLGLFIVREIAEAHGGKVSVTSDESATIFFIELPSVE
jgi:sigma-B regulation protein RsbU (phosphoserine phosphatase)